MRAEEAAEVRQLGLFRTCEADTFSELVRPAFLQRFPVGVELIHEGEPTDFLYIVVEGLVEMYAGHAGRETTVSVVAPVGTFILAAVIRDAQHLQSARTLARSRLLMIPASSIREAIAADPLFAAAAMAQLAQEYRDVVRSLKGQKLRNGAERLANWLLQRSADGHAAIEMPFEKRVLASLLGMTPENLSRAFKTLQPYGVCVDGTTITLADRADLMTLAKPDPLIDDPSV